MQTEEVEEAQEDEEEAEGDASIPMDDRGAEAAAVAEEEKTNKVEAEEEDDGDVTEAENRLLDTPPPPNSESMAPGLHGPHRSGVPSPTGPRPTGLRSHLAPCLRRSSHLISEAEDKGMTPLPT